MEAKKWPEMLAKLKEVEASAGQDAVRRRILMNEMYRFVYVRSRSTIRSGEVRSKAAFNSGFLPEEELPNRVKALAQVNYQIKNYDKAIEFGTRPSTPATAMPNTRT